jgi:hypothetical protein
MAFGSGRKPKNQGSAGSAHTQKPATSSKPSKGGEAPTTAQDHRGYRTPGVGGSGKAGPKSFKA